MPKIIGSSKRVQGRSPTFLLALSIVTLVACAERRVVRRDWLLVEPPVNLSLMLPLVGYTGIQRWQFFRLCLMPSHIDDHVVTRQLYLCVISVISQKSNEIVKFWLAMPLPKTAVIVSRNQSNNPEIAQTWNTK